MYKDYKNIEMVKPAGLDLKDRLVGVQRVTKVTKGGRNFGFSAIVVVGDENGVVGQGLGKSKEVSEAISKAVEDAKKNLLESLSFMEKINDYKYIGTVYRYLGLVELNTQNWEGAQNHFIKALDFHQKAEWRPAFETTTLFLGLSYFYDEKIKLLSGPVNFHKNNSLFQKLQALEFFSLIGAFLL